MRRDREDRRRNRNYRWELTQRTSLSRQLQKRLTEGLVSCFGIWDTSLCRAQRSGFRTRADIPGRDIRKLALDDPRVAYTSY